MLSYPRLNSPALELVLCVRQGARPRRFDHRLSQIAARIERTREYRRSLAQLLALGQQFQDTLDASQRQSWLALEDALLEHTSQLNQAYFQAGVELGRKAGHGRRGRANVVSWGAERARDREIISQLAQMIRKLAAR
jgi:hypothetical protein